jgi:hypothetical protein
VVAEVFERYQQWRCATPTPSTSTTSSSSRWSCCAAHPDVLARYRERFHFLLVDEYQDTNRAQYHFLKLMRARRPEAEHREPLRGGRRRPVDLRLAGRRHPQHPRLREGFPRIRLHRAAGGELPLDPQRILEAPTG